MPALLRVALILIALTCTAHSAPLSETDLKNLLAGIRQNRSTQADFQEQRVIRLMKKPVVSSNQATLWDVLRHMKVDSRGLRGGRLFEEHGLRPE